MNIYKVSRTDEIGWDEYDAFVCIAETAVDAINTHPCENRDWDDPLFSGWIERKNVDFLKVEYVGTTSDGPARIVLSSFCAG